MNPIRVYLLLPMLALVLACATTPRVHTDYLPREEFGRYRTSAPHPGITRASQVNPEIGPTLVARARQAATDSMRQRGFEQVDPVRADLLVVVHGHLQDKIDLRPYGYAVPSAYYGHHGHHHGHGHWYGLGYHAVDYREGTLIVDLIDRERKELVWRGWSRHRLSSRRPLDPDKLAAEIDRILQQFPPGSAPPVE